MDTLQTLFRATIADMLDASREEAADGKALGRLVEEAQGVRDPTELCERWQARRQKTMHLFERQQALAQAIRDVGGTPRV